MTHETPEDSYVDRRQDRRRNATLKKADFTDTRTASASGRGKGDYAGQLSAVYPYNYSSVTQKRSDVRRGRRSSATS